MRLLPYFQLFLLLLFPILGDSQTLSIPPRSGSALEGSQIIPNITNLSLHDREVYILNEVLTGNIPDFYRTLKLVTDSTLISGTYKHISYYVLPDYLALGSDADYFLCPMTPILGQRIADSLNCSLPTRKMVNQIWADAAVKMQPQSIPPSPQMTTVPIFAEHDSTVWVQRQTFMPSLPLGELVSGDKKDVVISNLIYTTSSPARVVIYGWHYPTGSNIQPLYAGHIDTYADYSHGIRLVQNECWVDGVPNTISDVLMSSTLNTLLSDEGVLAQPYYPDTVGTTPVVTIPFDPISFCVLAESNTSLRVRILPNSSVDSYQIYTSTDGLSYPLFGIYTSSDFVLAGLDSNAITFVKIKASNSAGTSGFSEVLAAVPTDSITPVLIVNGFDRLSGGNTQDFVRQHGSAIFNSEFSFSSATNDALIDGLLDISEYEAIDWILGEESTNQSTFSSTEQTITEEFLKNGGYLFVSGAEIGWDLDALGTTSDQDFYHNFLKAQYIYDAPNDVANTYYSFEESSDTLFQGLGTTSFDDGTMGTYNVDYPDVIEGVNGGINCLQYSSLVDNYAGIYFKGIFPSGIDTAKLVHFGFPFETIYPESQRFSIMNTILNFFFPPVPLTTLGINWNDDKFVKLYPNPCHDVLNVTSFNSESILWVEILSLEGNLIQARSFIRNQLLDVSLLVPGIYICKIQQENDVLFQKFIKN